MNTLRQKIEDSTLVVLDSLSQHPIIKGALPAFGSVAFSYWDIAELWLRRSTLILGFIIALLTIVAKIRDLRKGGK